MESLRELEEIEELKENIAPDGVVKVSPAKSASSKTEVRLESSLSAILEKLREEWRLQNQGDFKKLEKKIRTDLEPETEATALMTMRNIENMVLGRIAEVMGDDEPMLPYSEYVHNFQEKYRVKGFRVEELNQLGHSNARRKANDFAHLKLRGSETQMFVKHLDDHLARKGRQEERARYSKYYNFAIGKFEIVPR